MEISAYIAQINEVESEKRIYAEWCRVLCLFFVTIGLTMLLNCASAPKKVDDKLSGIVWVAYSPTKANPNQGFEASVADMREDLVVLRNAGFTGLVTYSSVGVMSRDLPGLAQSLGFQGLIVGVWDPSSTEELTAAKTAASNPIVLGFCVGNEGLQKRYQMSLLSSVIADLRNATGKPVTTTEEIDDYSDENLLRLGDWVFPNVHPYFHNQLESSSAVRWTKGAYDDLKRRAGRLVIFKEVGLPTEGDTQGKLSEVSQEQYYLELAKTGVQFVYFEAFDQPWKTHLPIEPHWGIFKSDRSPKALGRRRLGKDPLVRSNTPPAFSVYTDIDSPDNHFRPTGFMGDIGDIHVNEAFSENPRSGKTCIRIAYDAKGKGPNECPYSPPCNWAGVYWQEPPNNWGKTMALKGRGFDLSPYNRLVFWAKADRECTIEFKVGGISESYGDSLSFARSRVARLNKDWQEFEIDLAGGDLTHLIGGFCWVTNQETNPGGTTFYLDDIRFVKR
jgi:exo-beta-1,3-glucanase (GH17 family)